LKKPEHNARRNPTPNNNISSSSIRRAADCVPFHDFDHEVAEARFRESVGCDFPLHLPLLPIRVENPVAKQILHDFILVFAFWVVRKFG